MNNHVRLGLTLLLLLGTCYVLSACVAPLQPSTGGLPPAQAAQRSAEQGRYARAAELYAYAARQQTDPAQQAQLRLDAALAALQAQRSDMARRQLAAIDTARLSETDYQRYELTQTLLRMASMSPEQALEQLPPPAGGTPPQLAAYIWKTRAQLLFQQYQYVAGIHNLVQRSVWLLDEQQIRRNNQLIFKRALEAVELGRGSDSAAAQQADATTLGWLRLAEIRTHGPRRGPELQQALKRWEDQFTGHPATLGLLSSEFNYQPYSTPQAGPRPGGGIGQGNIMLALPLSGELAQPAQAIRAGFEMARANSAADRAITVVDASSLTAGDIVRQARQKGTALIVGPLQKTKVASLARMAPGLPVLALNQIQSDSTPPSFYRYALAPEDDARTAAEHAAANGWRNALALVPEGEWGSRVLDAFRDAFARHGGTLVDYASFATNRYDHQAAVQSVLRRYHSGAPVDFIFIAARPTHARLLRSQLRFYRAARLPVIATSDAYSGLVEPRKDADLNGVAFAAIPWIVGSGPSVQEARDQATASGGAAAQRFPRLFAMGIDAWRLTEQWLDGGLQPGTTLRGTTGLLEVTPSGRIRRHLAWARFVDGRAQLVEPAADTGAGAPQPVVPTAADGQSAATTPANQDTQPAKEANYGPVYSSEETSSVAPQGSPTDQEQEPRPDYGPSSPESTPPQTSSPSDYGPVYPEDSAPTGY